MISDYPYTFQFTRGLEYLTAINFDEFTTCGSDLRNDSISNTSSHLADLCEGCISLTSVHIPKSFEVIPSSIFARCKSLSSVTIDEGITEVKSDAFYNCESLKNLILPKSLEKLEYFVNLPELSSITIPENVRHINTLSFDNCPKLKTVTFKSKTQVYPNIENLSNPQKSPLETLYVQPNLLEAYKTSEEWRSIADKIKPIEE